MTVLSIKITSLELTHKKGNRKGMKLLQVLRSLTHKKSNHNYRFESNKYGGFL
jgi:hypothetical protein